MFDPKTLEEMAKKFTEKMPCQFQALQADVQASFQSALQYSFSKLDLVTREEFDVQTEVLARTRAKVEALETRVTELEKQLQPELSATPEAEEESK